MRYVVCGLFLFLVLSCGDSGTVVREDVDRPCYDECEKNGDCLEGLACSEWAGHICVPIPCVACWTVQNRVCIVEEVYDKNTYPTCTFSQCKQQ